MSAPDFPHADVEFIDTPAPEFFAHGLYDVDVFGTDCRITPFIFKRSQGGVLIREPPFTFVLPTNAIVPSFAMMLRKVGATIRADALHGAGIGELLLH